MDEFEITFLMSQMDILKKEKSELETENKTLRRQIDEIYKCWLFDSNQYQKIKEEIREIKSKMVCKNDD